MYWRVPAIRAERLKVMGVVADPENLEVAAWRGVHAHDDPSRSLLRSIRHKSSEVSLDRVACATVPSTTYRHIPKVADGGRPCGSQTR